MFRKALVSVIALSLALPSVAQAHTDPLPVGTCMNMGNSLEPEQEGSWGGQPISEADFKRIRKAGFTTVRIPVRWYNKSDEKAPHAIDEKWMKRVQQVVDWALANDLNVVLNSHHFEPMYEDPIANAPWLAGVWKQIAQRFAAYPKERLWFEIENEPHKNFTNANLVAGLSPALAEIRKTNPERAVIVGGGDWSSIDSLATLDLPDDPNIHPTFHYYAPHDFTHQGAAWAGNPPVGRMYGTQEDQERLTRDVQKLRDYIARTGKTPFMGETGAYDAHIPLKQRIEYHSAVRQAFAPTGIGMCMWGYANTFPFYDSKAGEWIPGLRGAIGLPEDD